MTFNLHEARWHDGEPVTADDVVFSLDRMAQTGVTRGRVTAIRDFYERGTATAVDDLTVEMPLKFVSSTAMGWLARFTRTKPLGAVGGAITVILILIAVFAPQISPYGPKEALGSENVHLSPSVAFPMGTDHIGRDVPPIPNVTPATIKEMRAP